MNEINPTVGLGNPPPDKYTYSRVPQLQAECEAQVRVVTELSDSNQRYLVALDRIHHQLLSKNPINCPPKDMDHDLFIMVLAAAAMDPNCY